MHDGSLEMSLWSCHSYLILVSMALTGDILLRPLSSFQIMVVISEGYVIVYSKTSFYVSRKAFLEIRLSSSLSHSLGQGYDLCYSVTVAFLRRLFSTKNNLKNHFFKEKVWDLGLEHSDSQQ